MVVGGVVLKVMAAPDGVSTVGVIRPVGVGNRSVRVGVECV